jgi:hypothetical protein
MTGRYSVAMTGATSGSLREHLLRADRQEDVCFATYSVSTGACRTTALLRDVILPGSGEREVHGNASFSGDYVLRAATVAAEQECGLALLHSHPGASGWQGLSSCDHETEASYATFVRGVTKFPLVGLTLGGRDLQYSARFWHADQEPTWCENVRVLDDTYTVAWNDALRPAPAAQPSQDRTISAWGPRAQANLARLRILIVGVGSVGLDIAIRLAATGIQHVDAMDPDTLKIVNLDRMTGATREDAELERPKVEVALRLMRSQATAVEFKGAGFQTSVYYESAHAQALDYDLIISAVDRPWPRAVMNTLAYADLIPVIDGGIAIDAFADGNGMRGASWRSHVIRPGRPCLVCNRQLDLALVTVEQSGDLDDPEYIRNSGRTDLANRANVAALCSGPISAILSQFVSFVVGVGGQGEAGPLQYSLAAHHLEHLDYASRSHCPFENAEAVGDKRMNFTVPDPSARDDAAATPAAHATVGSSHTDVPCTRLRHLLRLSARLMGPRWRTTGDQAWDGRPSKKRRVRTTVKESTGESKKK